MHPPTLTPARSAGAVAAGLLRAIVSLVALVGLLAGVPAALLLLGRLPAGVPTADGVWETLTQPDDGTVLVAAVTLAGWVLWLLLVAAVVVEAAALVRRRAARRRRGLGGLQQLAAWLLGGIITLSAPAVAAATAQPAAAQGLHTEQNQEEQAGGAEAGDRSGVGAELGAEPVLTVPDGGGTLWGIAEAELGSGQRWQDIAALNPGIEADTDTSGVIRPGTELLMPTDWTPAAVDGGAAAAREQAPQDEQVPQDASPGPDQAGATADTETAKPEPRPEEEPELAEVVHVVEPGDTLWAITGEHRGDATAWPEVYDANRDIIGGDPHLIYPGQEITVHGAPDAASGETPAAPPAPEAVPDGEEPAPDGDDRQEADSHEAPGADGPAGADQPAEPPPADTGTGETSPPMSGTAESGAADAGTDSRAADDNDADGAGLPAAAVVGGGAVLAAGVVGLLAHQRRRQQARRRRGHRIARPDGRTARTEQALRHTQVGDQLQALRAALQTAALHLTDAGRPLPELAAVTLTADQAELHLIEPTQPVPPFTTASGEPGTLWSAAYGVDLADRDELGDVDAPYPGLVSVGHTDDGALVLVDLEHVGALQLTGPWRREMLRTLAVELSASELADHLELALVGAGLAPALEQLGVPERLTRYDQLAAAAQTLGRQHQQQLELLERSGTGSLRQARAEGALGEGWSPLIVMADSAFVADPDEEAALQSLVEMVLPYPRAAAAIVTSGVPADADPGSIGGTDGVWVVPTDGSPVQVPGTGLWITPQPLTDDEYGDIVAMTQIAETGPDTPAPTREEPTADPAPAAPLPADAKPADTASETAAAVPEQPLPAAAGPSATDLLAQLAACAPSPDSPDVDPAPAVEPAGDPAQDTAAPATPAVATSAPLPPGNAAGTAEVATPLPPGNTAPATPLAAPATATGEGPMIRVLGPVDLVRPAGKIATDRRRPTLEAAVWIALNPDTDQHAMDEALWPGQRVTSKTRAPRISNLRAWLGRDPDGDHYLPVLDTATSGMYRFADAVQVDWHLFEDLAARGAAAPGETGEELLRTALGLVRGRPFAGVSPHRYAWAEHLAQDMISAIVDVAEDLAERCLARDDARGALWAATKGLAAAAEAEQLHRAALRAHHALGDGEGLERAARTLNRLLTEWQVDMQDETAQLLHDLLTTPHRPADAAATA